VFLPLGRLFGATAEQASPEERRDSRPLQDIDVLLVEDESSARVVLGRLLEQHGAQVRGVGSAAQAFEAFELRRPSLIIADVGMPDEDGYSLITRLRRLEQERGIKRVPAVAVTAFARGEDRARALAAGFDDHLPKPIDIERLVALLTDLLRDAKTRS